MDSYEKKYNEALERAKQFSEHPLLEDSGNIVEYIFPELKELEDERIKKDLIGFFKDEEFLYHKKEEIVEWLEKQNEKFQYWKPSEKQLEALDYAYNSCPDTEIGNYYEGVLETIIDDLHKLSEKQGEQKPVEWSKEDNKIIDTLIKIFEVNYPDGFYKINPIGTTNMQGIHSFEIINWLKSLKERVGE